jgi:hypothetical protein
VLADDQHSAKSRTAEFVCASAVGVAALTLYAATLQPDFGGPEDTPKFQFLGYVLGSAHPPGYPLYVLLTHAFVRIPIGTIAYRANLFSALMAAVACVVAYTTARRLGAGRIASIGAAIGLASGAAFWRSAVFAEVYSLAAALAALTVALLLAWGRSGRLSTLLAATTTFALGLGNHLTIVGLAPACVAYVLVKNRRVLTLPVTAATCLILILGASQYGLIVLRTRQSAPYMESRAESLPELWRVVTAERFAGERFAFGPKVLLTVHLPAAVAAIGRDLGVVGSVLCALGVIALLWAAPSSALLLLGAIGGLLAMVVNLAGDLQGFVTSLLPLVWPLFAVGIECATRAVGRLNGSRTLKSVVVFTLAAAAPVSNIDTNYRAVDQSDHKEEGRFLRAFFSQLPERAAVVAQDYSSDMAIQYMTLTGEGGAAHDIARIGFSPHEVEDALREGKRVFVFATGATVLSAEGFRFERMLVNGPPVERWLEWLPRSTLLIGASAHVPLQLDLRSIGHAAARPIGRLRSYEAFGVEVGSSRADWRSDDGPVTLRPFDGSVSASSDERGARVERDGHTVARVDEGLALTAMAADGSVLQPLEFAAGGSTQVPFQEAVYEITGQTRCAVLTGDWQDITPVFQTGSWVATLHQRGEVIVEVAVASTNAVTAKALVLLGNGVAGPISRRVEEKTPVLSARLTRTGDYRPVFRLALDRIPGENVKARIRGGSVKTVKVCSHEPLVSLFSTSNQTLLRPDFEAEPHFGAGWSEVERTSSGRRRRAVGKASLFLNLSPAYSYKARFELDAETPTRISILANGMLAGACEVTGSVRCEINLPRDSVRAGINTLAFTDGTTGAPRTFALHRVELSRQRLGL